MTTNDTWRHIVITWPVAGERAQVEETPNPAHLLYCEYCEWRQRSGLNPTRAQRRLLSRCRQIAEKGGRLLEEAQEDPPQ